MSQGKRIQHFGPTPADAAKETESSEAEDKVPLMVPVQMGGIIVMQQAQGYEHEGAVQCVCVCHLNLANRNVTCSCWQDVTVFHE